MVRSVYRSVWISLAVAVFFAIVPMVNAQDREFSASDKATIRAYVLNPAKLNAYVAATNAFAAAMKSDRALAEEWEAIGRQPNSLAAMKASLAAHPRLFGFYQAKVSAWMTSW
jgi:hypothetical protein